MASARYIAECDRCGWKRSGVSGRHAGRGLPCPLCSSVVQVPKDPIATARRSRVAGWSGWAGLGYAAGGLLLAIVFGVIAYALSVASSAAIGRFFVILWIPAALGVVTAIAGTVDATRAIVSLARGHGDPGPRATRWIDLRARQMGLA